MDKLNLPPLKNYPSRKEWEGDCWRRILKLGKPLHILATPYERRNLVMRAAVIDMLASGKKYREIAEELLLSPQTINTIKKALKENGYRSYRERSKKERKKRKYAGGGLLPKKPSRPRGKPVRTKYGILYIPNY